jgi:hypothetical protein
MSTASRPAVIGAICALTLIQVACGAVAPRPIAPLPPRPVQAKRPAQAQRLLTAPTLQGVASSGRVGDFQLLNERLIAVVRGLGARIGRGALVDLGSALERRDGLGGLEPLVGRKQLRPPRYRSLHVEQLGASARITLRGHDPRHPRVQIETRYLLEPGRFLLEISTSVQNNGPSPLTGYRVADRLRCGATDPYLLGSGWVGPGARLQGSTIEFYGAKVSYAYVHEMARFELRSSDTAVTAAAPATTLQPGVTQTFRRLLVLGGSDLGASLRAPLLERGAGDDGAALLIGLDERGEPLEGGLVTLTRDGKPDGLARLGDDGRALLRLSAGSYRFRLRAKGRRAPLSETLELRSAERRSLTLTTGPPSQLVYDVRDKQTRKPLAVRVAIKDLDDAQPWFGPRASATPGAVVLDPYGLGVRPLPPGRYEVTISAGPRYRPQRRTVSLAPHAGASVVVYLERAPGLGQRSLAIQPTGGFAATSTMNRQLWNRVGGVHAALWPAADAARHRRAISAMTKGADPKKRAGHDTLLLAERRDAQGVRLLVGDGRDFERRWLAYLRRLRAGERAVALATQTVDRLDLLTDVRPLNWLATTGGGRALLAALRAGKGVVSNGPLLACTASAQGPANRKGPGELLSIRGKGRRVKLVVRCKVSAAGHQLTDSLRPFVGGVAAAKALPLPGRESALRASPTFELSLDRRRGDSSIVVLLRGHRDPRVGPRLPLIALSNPIWVDADGDGRWRALAGRAVVPVKARRSSRRAPPRSARRARSRRRQGKRGRRSTSSRRDRRGR